MSLELISNKVETIKLKLEILSTELNNLDFAINNTESPDDSALLAELFDQKVGEFHKLEAQFKKLLEEFNAISQKENNSINFVAKKLLKVIS